MSYYLMASSTMSNRPVAGGTWAYGRTRTRWAHPRWRRTRGRNLAATFDGAAVRLYVNGVQVASQAQTTALVASTGTLQIGGDGYPGEYLRRAHRRGSHLQPRPDGRADHGRHEHALAPAADTAPPVLSGAQPSGTLAAGTNSRRR
jgi:hypothetical protein